jgi:hypothetical protein
MNTARGACTKVQSNGLVDGCGEYTEDPTKPRHCEACLCHQNFHPFLKKHELQTEVGIEGTAEAPVLLSMKSSEGLPSLGMAASSDAAPGARSGGSIQGTEVAKQSEGKSVLEAGTGESGVDLDVRRSPRIAAAAPQAGVKRGGAEPQSLAAKFQKVNSGNPTQGTTSPVAERAGPFTAKFAEVQKMHGTEMFQLIHVASVKNPWRIKCNACQVDVACGPHKSLSNFDKHLQTLRHADAVRAEEEKVKEEAARAANFRVENEQKQEAWLKKWASEGGSSAIIASMSGGHAPSFCFLLHLCCDMGCLSSLKFS